MYLDDSILSKDSDQLLKNIEKVSSTLYESSVSLKLKNFHLFTIKVELLGHKLMPHRLSITEAHSKRSQRHEAPAHFDRASLLLGMCNVYHRLIPSYSHISAQINRLLKKGQPPKSSPLDETKGLSFQTLIKAILSTPVLELPRSGLPYSADSDACDHQLGAELFRPCFLQKKTIPYRRRNI